MKIVTHPGQAHRDDFVSCCLLLAAEGEAITSIERRDATPEDLSDPNVIVLDQGGEHNPNLMNFDHHQFDRNAEPACSITLILQHLGYDIELCREVFTWLEFSERLDSKGPFATSEHYSIPVESFWATLSPIESQILRAFEAWSTTYVPIMGMMDFIGRGLLEYLHSVMDRLELLNQSKIDFTEDVTILDTRHITSEPSLAVEIWIKRESLEPGRKWFDIDVVLSNDDRGPGFSLYRRNDSPKIDFSKLEGHPDVLFAHKGGFIAKTKTKDANLLELIHLATV